MLKPIRESVRTWGDIQGAPLANAARPCNTGYTGALLPNMNPQAQAAQSIQRVAIGMASSRLGAMSFPQLEHVP